MIDQPAATSYALILGGAAAAVGVFDGEPSAEYLALTGYTAVLLDRDAPLQAGDAYPAAEPKKARRKTKKGNRGE